LPDGAVRQGERGERRVEAGGELLVAVADDGDVVRHRQAAAGKLLIGAEGDPVAGAEQRGRRLWQVEQPGRANAAALRRAAYQHLHLRAGWQAGLAHGGETAFAAADARFAVHRAADEADPPVARRDQV